MSNTALVLQDELQLDMQPLYIGDFKIERTTNGLYNLNNLHAASGLSVSKEPSKFRRNKQTHILISKLEQSVKLHVTSNPILVTQHGGKPETRGTYACKEIVYAYAMWLSAEFAIKVIRTFDDVATGKYIKAEGQPTLSLPFDVNNPAEVARQLAHQIERLAHTKAEYAENILCEKFVKNIVNSGCNIRLNQYCHFVGMGSITLLRNLRAIGILGSGTRHNTPRQDLIDLGYFTFKPNDYVETVLQRPTTVLKGKVKITGQGQVYVHSQLLKAGIITKAYTPNQFPKFAEVK